MPKKDITLLRKKIEGAFLGDWREGYISDMADLGDLLACKLSHSQGRKHVIGFKFIEDLAESIGDRVRDEVDDIFEQYEGGE